ncbi:MAG: hypothetical protein Q8O68_00550 [Candidatus Daviesbacteria bacterium]|nr:hypothetical protein [Candidatus Daviesbacteria bacterium]
MVKSKTGKTIFIIAGIGIGLLLLSKSVSAGGADAGPQGPQGPQGPEGPQGPQGASITGGRGPPAAPGRRTGDVYVDLLTGDMYVWDDDTQTWNFVPGQVFQGPQGPVGLSGEQWFSGAGIPDDSFGNNGDFYIDISNGDVYEKVNDTWF